MPKFLIRLHGEHYKIPVETNKFPIGKRLEWKDVGFYATRFVESGTADEAIETAFEIIRKELNEIAESVEKSSLKLDEIQENEEAFNSYAPGEGFSFYTGDEE